MSVMSAEHVAKPSEYEKKPTLNVAKPKSETAMVIGHQEQMFLDELIVEKQFYPKNHPLQKLIEQRVGLLQPDEEIQSHLVVDPEVNGFALPGVVVINDGLLRKLEYVEELDAVLAHELSHVKSQHHKQLGTFRGESMIKRLGKTRQVEVEADIFAMEMMDRVGVNPYGALSMLDKLADEIEHEIAGRPPGRLTRGVDIDEIRRSADVEHGSIESRKANIEQVLWLTDVRNLSRQNLTTLDLDPINFIEQADQTERILNINPEHLENNHQKFLLLQRQIDAFVKLNPRAPQKAINEMMAYQLQSRKSIINEVFSECPDAEKSFLITASFLGDTSHHPSLDLIFEQLQSENWKDRVVNPDSITGLFTACEKLEDSNLGFRPQGRALEGIYGRLLEKGLTDYSFSLYSLATIQQQMPQRYGTFSIQAELAFRHFYKLNGENSEVMDFVSQQNFNIDSLADWLSEKIIERKPDQATRVGMDEIERDKISGEDYYDKNVDPLKLGAVMLAHRNVDYRRILGLRGDFLSAQENPLPYIAWLSNPPEYLEREYGIELQDYTQTIGLSSLYEACLMFKQNPFHDNLVLQSIKDSILDDDVFYHGDSNPFGYIVATEFLDLVKSGKGSELAFKFPAAIIDGKDSFVSYVNRLLVELSEEDVQPLNIFNTLNRITQAFNEVSEELGRDTNLKFGELASLDTAKYLMVNHIIGKEVKKKGLTVFDPYLEQFAPVAYSTVDVSEYENFWRTSAERLAKNKSTELTPGQLSELMYVGLASANLNLQLSLPSQAVLELAKSQPLETNLELLFDKLKAVPKQHILASVQFLVEEQARTLEDFESLESYIKDALGLVFEQNVGLVGFASLLEGFLNPGRVVYEQKRGSKLRVDLLQPRENSEILATLLSSHTDDEALQKLLFDYWWRHYHIDRGLDDFAVHELATWHHPGKEARLRFWMQQQPNPRAFVAFSQLRDDVYRMGGVGKFALTRDLLLGPKGVLKTEETRAQMGDQLIDHWLDFSNRPGAEPVVRELLSSMVQSTNPVELYVRIEQIIRDMILQPPEHPTDIDKIAQDASNHMVKKMSDNEILGKIYPITQPALETKIRALMSTRKKGSYIDLNESLLEKYVPVEKDSRAIESSDPMDVALKLGSSLGSVGVRFLQLSAQYFDIPAEYQARFNESFDNVVGQTRFQAVRTLRREAEHSAPLAKLLEDTAEIRPRIGGGSLVTVYEIVKKNGQREAVAVKNPNVEYHMEAIVGLAGRSLARAIEQSTDPERKQYYQLGQSLLGEVQDWILAELHDAEFGQKDEQFRQDNDYRYHKFENGNNHYRIYVPQAYPTDTDWVRRDEYIEGTNLAGLEIASGPTDIENGKISTEDMRQVVSLLSRNYLYQLFTTGLAHSDIHPGNFRITPDNKSIAVFDRYNLLKIDKTQQKLFRGMLNGFTSGGLKTGAEVLQSYLNSLPQNSEVSNRKDLEFSSQAEENLETQISSAVVELKSRGYHIPLTISLVFKNLLSLQKMSQRAGFNSLVEAILLTASPQKIGNLVGG